MSHSDTGSDRKRKRPPFVGPGMTKRIKTFDSGAEAPPTVPATKEAKKTLKGVLNGLGVGVEGGTFQYQKLQPDEIRILNIFPGLHDEPIECSLIPIVLPCLSQKVPAHPGPKIEYEALSYWWGNDIADQKLKIHQASPVARGANGDTWSGYNVGTINIRPNLKAAIQQLRSKEHEVCVWVDALCINQPDAEEKAHQVSMMHKIYAEAESVCVWLGAGKPETEETIEFLKEILDLSQLDNLIEGREKNAQKWELVVKLLENRWFSRRWVIQELALAKRATVRWGTAEIQWVDFKDAIALFMTRHDEIKKILSAHVKYPVKDPFGDIRALGANTLVNATNNLFRKSDDGKVQQRLLSLEVLVSCLLLAFEASDPRDTIYAALSIAKDTSSSGSELMARNSWLVSSPLQSFRASEDAPASVVPERAALDSRVSPDYAKCLMDVWSDFMEYCIERSQSLDILCRHWAPETRRKTFFEKARGEAEKMPSWIPSLKGSAFGHPEQGLQGRLNGDSFVGNLERENQQHYNASAGLKPWVKFGKHENPSTRKPESTMIGSQKSEEHSSSNPSKQALGRHPTEHRKYNGKLTVKGYCLDEISEVSNRVSGGIIVWEALEMGGWPKQDRDEEKRERVPEQLWRTLVADRGPNATNAPAWYHRACLECLQWADDNGDLNTNDLSKNEGVPSTIIMFLERVQRVIYNRRFFKTKGRPGRSSLIGLAPPSAKPGDHICIIYGCSVPVLLTKAKNSAGSENLYEVVGESYVHGMMDGEAIPAVRPEYPYEGHEKFTLV